MKTPASPLEELRNQLADARRRAADLEEQLEAERRQRRLIQEISRSLELEHLLYIFEQEVERLGAFDGFLINFVTPERDGLVCSRVRMPASHQGLAASYQNYRFAFEPGEANTLAFNERRVLVVNAGNLDHQHGLVRQGYTTWQASEIAVIPIPYCDTAMGTVVAFRQDGAIPPEAVAELEQRLLLFNAQIRNALLFHELKSQEQAIQSALEEHRKFLEFVSRVNTLTSPEQIFQAIVTEFIRAFRFDVASLALAEDGRLVFKRFECGDPAFEASCRALAEYCATPPPLSFESGVTAFTYLRNAHIYVEDVQPVAHLPMADWDRQAFARVPTLRTALHVPVRERGKPIGVLSLSTLREPRPVPESELKIIELLASFVGTAVGNALLYSVIGDQKGQIEALNKDLQQKVQQLDEMVRRDQLTGLHNFGAFRSELTRRAAEASRESDHRGLSVVVIDVDHFKRFNDTYGHLAGNIVLREVAARIERVARTMDIPCRFGGEEFVVILPKCDLDGAGIFGERLRRVIADTPFAVDDRLLAVTVSVGCATFRPGETTDDFLARADQALYRAKQNGRDRVELEADAD